MPEQSAALGAFAVRSIALLAIVTAGCARSATADTWRELRSEELPNPDELRALDREGFYARDDAAVGSLEALKRRIRNYTAAYCLVHALALDEPALRPPFITYLEALRSARADPGAAWNSAFGGANEEGVRRAYRAFLAHDDIAIATKTYSPRAIAVRDVRPMSAAAVRVIRAMLRDWSASGGATSARVDLDAAIGEAPRDPEVWLARGTLRFHRGELEGARADLERALTLAPDDPRYLFPLASSAEPGALRPSGRHAGQPRSFALPGHPSRK